MSLRPLTRKRRAVEEGAAAAEAGEHLVGDGIVDHAADGLVPAPERDGDGVVLAVEEVGRPVDGVTSQRCCASVPSTGANSSPVRLQSGAMAKRRSRISVSDARSASETKSPGPLMPISMSRKRAKCASVRAAASRAMAVEFGQDGGVVDGHGVMAAASPSGSSVVIWSTLQRDEPGGEAEAFRRHALDRVGVDAAALRVDAAMMSKPASSAASTISCAR